MEFKNCFDGVINIDDIKKIISSENIKIVSFDIFDTLLIRPSFEPRDIFHLVAAKVDKLYGVDFIEMRFHAEEEIGNNDLNLSQIYDYIKRKYKLTERLADLLQKEELACEKHFLNVRTDMMEVYNYAVKLGKRVIAVSDMYLGSDFLLDVLQSKGYSEIKKVYVSNEAHCRKDTGKLYDYVFDQERVRPEEFCHLGDNYHSDFECALAKGITAIYYPSVKDIAFAAHSIFNQVWLYNDNGIRISPDPAARVIMGYALHELLKSRNNYAGEKVFDTFEHFVQLGLAPVLFYIAHKIATNEEIQQNYEKMFFASRDGYLPKIAYDIVSKHMDIIPSEYVYCGRRAYSFIQYDNILNFLSNAVQKNKFTFKSVILNFITDNKLSHKILNSLTDEEVEIDFISNRKKCISLLKKFEIELNAFYEHEKKNAIEYYTSIFNIKNVIFDAGYSGSIWAGLSSLKGKEFQKVYLWETSKNQEQDQQNNIHTILLMNDPLPSPFHLVYEELFSPLESGCIGFRDKKPVFECISFSERMKEIYAVISTKSANAIENFCCYFGEYLSFIKPYDTTALQRPIFYAFGESPYAETSLFKDIYFPDPVAGVFTSLGGKLYQWMNTENVFSLTGFEDPSKKINFKAINVNSNKIGIHIHMFYADLFEELLLYLKEFPYKFDLFITVVKDEYINILSNVFNKTTIKNLDNIEILTVTNRGRDVAPWLVSMAYTQKNYDLFCHLHTKKSYHLGKEMGTDWRRYLYRNLLEQESVRSIIAHFEENKTLGCVFPKEFPPLAELCKANKIPQEGDFGEIEIINDLMRRMGINRPFIKSDLFFSEGTMMWYRPAALKRLFDLNLTYEDFPPEPIGVGGTIAHAIERLPALVCEESGYQARTFTPYPYQEEPAAPVVVQENNAFHRFIKTNKFLMKLMLLKYKIMTEITHGSRKRRYREKKNILKQIMRKK